MFRRPPRIVSSALAALVLAFSIPALAPVRAEVPAAAACPVVAPQATIDGVGWYADAAGSKVDPAALRAHLARIAEVRRYATALVSAYQRGDIGCASGLLQNWAAADALLQRPVNFAGIRERLRFGMAITFVTLRLVADGHPLDPQTKVWIDKLNRAIVADFDRRNVVDNLYVWSGAAAALAFLVENDRLFADYRDKVFRAAIGQIGPDGFVPSELRRETRASLYHAYYLSALLLIQAMRADPTGDADIEMLARVVREGSCAAADFARRNNLPPQERQKAIDQGLITLFGARLGPAPCPMQKLETQDPLLGGDLAQLRQTLQKVVGRGAQD
jgi:poly(beta-D-mannuronate) lyase